MRVPFVDLSVMHDPFRQEFEASISSLIETSRFIGGEAVEKFEAEFARYSDAKYAIGVANGTDALELALQAYGVGRGDEVITQANSFVATAAAIVRRGAKPVFVDIDPDTYTIDPNLIDAAITPHTKAIIPVHLYGQPADMDAINEIAKRRDLYVIEDSAQAHGAYYNGRRAGSLGHAACFSFYPGKNLGAFGDGGAVTSNDPEFIERITRLRDHGRTTKYSHAVVGTNSRLDAIQAAVLSIKLRELDRWNEQRAKAAERYASLLAGGPVKAPVTRDGSSHVFHLYVIETDDRDNVQARLDEAGVSTGIHYPIPLHQQPALDNLCRVVGPLTHTEASAARILSMPMFPGITDEQVRYAAEALIYATERRVGVTAAE